jgi:hypothetical protein
MHHLMDELIRVCVVAIVAGAATAVLVFLLQMIWRCR